MGGARPAGGAAPRGHPDTAAWGPCAKLHNGPCGPHGLCILEGRGVGATGLEGRAQPGEGPAAGRKGKVGPGGAEDGFKPELGVPTALYCSRPPGLLRVSAPCYLGPTAQRWQPCLLGVPRPGGTPQWRAVWGGAHRAGVGMTAGPGQRGSICLWRGISASLLKDKPGLPRRRKRGEVFQARTQCRKGHGPPPTTPAATTLFG